MYSLYMTRIARSTYLCLVVTCLACMLHSSMIIVSEASSAPSLSSVSRGDTNNTKVTQVERLIGSANQSDSESDSETECKPLTQCKVANNICSSYRRGLRACTGSNDHI